MPPNTFPSVPPSIPSTTSGSSFSGSAFVQIPNLPICVALTGFEQLEAVQNSVSRRTTTGQIANYTIDNLPIIEVPGGGTGAAFFNFNGVVIGSASSPLRSTLQGGANTVLVANNGEPFFSDAITVGTSITTPLLHVGILDIGSIVIDDLTVDNLTVTTSFLDQSLLANSVVFAGSGGLLSTDVAFTYSGGLITVPNVQSAFDGVIGGITPTSGAFTTLLANISITNSSLTPTRLIFSGLGGLETDSANLTFDGAILASTGFQGPLNGSVGAATPDTGGFTSLSANIGSFLVNVSSNAVFASNLFPGEVVYAGIVGKLISSSNLFFNGTILVSTGFQGPLNGIVGGDTPANGTFTNLFGSTVTTPNAQITGGSISGVSFSISTLTVDNFTATTTITNQSLTSGRVVFSGAGGLETDSPNLTFNGTILTSAGFSGPLNGTIGAITPNSGIFTSLRITAFTLGSIPFANATGILQQDVGLIYDSANSRLVTSTSRTSNMQIAGATSGIISIVPQSVAGTYTWTMPTTAGTSGQPILSGGASPLSYGTLSGNTSKFATVTGVFVAGHSVATDASGNFIDGGVPVASGTVNAGTINQVAWYAATGNAVSGLPTANNGTLITSGIGVPSISSTLPSVVQANITSLGTITSGIWNGGTIPVGFGGTSATAFTTNGVLYGNAASAIQVTAQGAANTILTANAGAPSFSAAPTIGTSVTTPLIIGGTVASSTLTLESTSGAGTTDSIIMKVASQVTRYTLASDGSSIFGGADGSGTPSSGILRAPTAAGANILGSDINIFPGNGTGTGGSGKIIFQVAPSAASSSTPNVMTPFMNISPLGVRIGSSTAATSLLSLNPGTTAVGTSPLKFSTGTSLTAPESGAVEYDGTNLYVTNHVIRRNISAGNMAPIAAATLTTVNANFGVISVFTGENYIFEMNIKLTASANTVIIGFNGASVGANNVTIEQYQATGPNNIVLSTLIVNSGGTVTTVNNQVLLRVTGIITATAISTFSMTLRTTAGTIALLAGSYFRYLQF